MPLTLLTFAEIKPFFEVSHNYFIRFDLILYNRAVTIYCTFVSLKLFSRIELSSTMHH